MSRAEKHILAVIVALVVVVILFLKKLSSLW
jgi:hypothetical protein